MLTDQDRFLSLLIRCHDTGNRMDLSIEFVSLPVIYVGVCGSNISPSCDKILEKEKTFKKERLPCGSGHSSSGGGDAAHIASRKVRDGGSCSVFFLGPGPQHME